MTDLASNLAKHGLVPPPPTTTKVVLSMICGNEERVINRCLDSVIEHVDAMVVSVNGKDRTEEIAREYGAHVVNEPWRDFGHNRTKAAQAARRHALRDLKFDPNETYLLLVDADMVFVVDDVEWKRKLTFPAYRIDQRSGNLRYENLRLIRLDHDWRCVGRTHEHWAPFPDVFPLRFDGVWIDDVNDGGEHGKKYERDVELLSKDLADKPGDPRALFYLAETFFHWGQQAEELKNKDLAVERFLRAAEFYSRRWEAGDWDEERFFAKFKQGLAALALERFIGGAGAKELLIEAYDARPSRAEPLAALARHYREAGKSAAAVLFAKAARALPPSKDTLFVDETANTTKPDEDIAISSYYTGDLVGGMAACRRLMRARQLGSHYQDFLMTKIAGFYVPPQVPAMRRGVFEIPEDVLEGGRWAPSSPTIVRYDRDWFLVGVRLVNYGQERGRWYTSRDPDGAIRTKTAVLKLSTDFETQEFLGIQSCELPPGWQQHSHIQGLEDQRWCVHDREIWFTATTFDGDPPRGPRVVLGRLSHDGLVVEHLVDLAYDRATDCEKNWVPRSVDGGGRFEIIYSYDPFVVLDVDRATGKCTERTRTTPAEMGQRWRGGAFDGNTGIVHEVVHHYREDENRNVLEDRRVYFHRLLDTTGAAYGCSTAPFTFEHQGVEYAAGIIDTGEGIVVTYSVEDKEARFVVLDYEAVPE